MWLRVLWLRKMFLNVRCNSSSSIILIFIICKIIIDDTIERQRNHMKKAFMLTLSFSLKISTKTNQTFDNFPIEFFVMSELQRNCPQGREVNPHYVLDCTKGFSGINKKFPMVKNDFFSALTSCLEQAAQNFAVTLESQLLHHFFQKPKNLRALKKGQSN